MRTFQDIAQEIYNQEKHVLDSIYDGDIENLIIDTIENRMDNGPHPVPDEWMKLRHHMTTTTTHLIELDELLKE